ncbi:hypothetical protein P4O66_004032 [Electrophorus voltai]|uniref:Uncharacterized protein n=1 Tax=Electrophorus voltai TaxID=2609070 RepID=A0AAD8ZQ24_9TELE|nr:hypothetical protein P4O66_004032 [Electrophorus voltai]
MTQRTKDDCADEVPTPDLSWEVVGAMHSRGSRGRAQLSPSVNEFGPSRKRGGLRNIALRMSEDVGVHQLQRLVELLTVHECEVLLLTISRPEENVFKQLDRLSAENNQLGLPPRTRRSLELGKNINQDKVLSLYRHVDAYDKFVNDAASRLTRSPPEEDRHTETAQRSARKVRGLARNDLDLVVKRHPVAPYERRVLDGAWPLLYGLLLGVGGAFVVGVLILLVTTHVSQRDRREPPLLYTRAKAGSRRHRRRNASSAEMVPSQPRDPRRLAEFVQV